VKLHEFIQPFLVHELNAIAGCRTHPKRIAMPWSESH